VNYSVSCRVLALKLSRGWGVGFAAQWSRARFPTAAGMGDRLWTDKPPQYFTKPARPTQPPTLSGTRNENQAKWSDLWPGSEGRLIPTWDERHQERLRDDQLMISAVQIRLILVVWLWVIVTQVYRICH